jgi:hypothetical protein
MRDTIDMAREAGAIHIHGKPKEFAIVGNDNIKDFEALVRADEREACAAECERMMMYTGGRQESAVHQDVWAAAKAIRAKGNT